MYLALLLFGCENELTTPTSTVVVDTAQDTGTAPDRPQTQLVYNWNDHQHEIYLLTDPSLPKLNASTPDTTSSFVLDRFVLSVTDLQHQAWMSALPPADVIVQVEDQTLILLSIEVEETELGVSVSWGVDLPDQQLVVTYAHTLMFAVIIQSFYDQQWLEQAGLLNEEPLALDLNSTVWWQDGNDEPGLSQTSTRVTLLAN